MSEQRTIVATFNTPEEAHLARNYLEAEGLAASLADEHAVGMSWHLGVAFGGVKLEVPKEQAERARQLLEARSLEQPAAPEPTEPAPETDAGCAEEEDRLQSSDVADEVEMPGDRLASRALKAALIGHLRALGL